MVLKGTLGESAFDGMELNLGEMPRRRENGKGSSSGKSKRTGTEYKRLKKNRRKMASIEDSPRNTNNSYSLTNAIRHRCIKKVKDVFHQYQYGNLPLTPSSCQPKKRVGDLHSSP